MFTFHCFLWCAIKQFLSLVRRKLSHTSCILPLNRLQYKVYTFAFPPCALASAQHNHNSRNPLLCWIPYFLLIRKFKCRTIACRPDPFPRSCFPCPETSTCCFWPEDGKIHRLIAIPFAGHYICSCLSPTVIRSSPPTSSTLHLFSGCNQEVLTFLRSQCQNSNFFEGTHEAERCEPVVHEHFIILPLRETIDKPQHYASTYA